MKIVKWDRQVEINETARAWTEKYTTRWPNHETTARLKALPENPTAEQFSAALGANAVWTFAMPQCHECKQPVAVRVELGAGGCDECDGTVEVCLDCLRKALALGEAAHG